MLMLQMLCGKILERPLKTHINEHQDYINNKQFHESQICIHELNYRHRKISQLSFYKKQNNSDRKIKESVLT